MRSVAWLWLAAACTAGERAEKREGSADSSAVPALLANSCEGEGCQSAYRAVACRDVNLVASPSNHAMVLALKRGDSIDVQTDLHLKKPGLVVLKRDLTLTEDETLRSAGRPTWTFAAGDTLLLLSYVGEGFWDVMYKGQRTQLQEFWAGPNQKEYGQQDSAQARVAVGTVPVIETWLRLSRSGRVIGWWRDDDSNAIAPIGAYAEKWELSCTTFTRP